MGSQDCIGPGAISEEARDTLLRAWESVLRRGLPFEGMPAFGRFSREVRFAFRRSWFDSFVQYERELTEQLREVERRRFLQAGYVRDGELRLAEATETAREASMLIRSAPVLRRWALQITRPWLSELKHEAAKVADSRELDDLLLKAQRLIAFELRGVQIAVDARLEIGEGSPYTVRAIRSLPNPPRGIQQFRNPAAVLADDPRREQVLTPDITYLGGADYGYEWRMERPERRWETSTWRVSWLGESSTSEVYAVEIRRGFDQRIYLGRVWMLGALVDRRHGGELLGKLERQAMGERNSLIVVAQEVAKASRRDRAQGKHGAG